MIPLWILGYFVEGLSKIGNTSGTGATGHEANPTT